MNEKRLEVSLHALSLIYRGELQVFYRFLHEYKDLFNEHSSYHSGSCFELKVRRDPHEIFHDPLISQSQYLVMEARGEYGSAS